MNKIPFITKTATYFLAILILFSGCVSSTLIQSNPSGAKIYMDEEPVGTTPYSHSDTRITGYTTEIKIVKEGYDTLITYMSRDEQFDAGAIVGGCFLIFPFLWTMKYKPVHSYELVPKKDIDMPSIQQTNPASKANRLRELKSLLDDKIITEEEFEKEKKKILDEK
jgi:hypothetical protein